MIAYTQALAASALFALNGTIAVLLLGGGVSPGFILAGRFWIAWAGLSVAFVLAGTRPSPIADGFRSIGPFAASVICSHLVFLLALTAMPVAQVLILVYIAPAILVVHESAKHRAMPSFWLVAAVALALVGAVLVLQPSEVEGISLQLLVLALALPISYAAYMTLAGRMPASIESRSLLWWTWCGAALVSAPLAIVQIPSVSALTGIALLYLGLLGTLGAFMLIIAAVRRAAPSRIAVVGVAEVPLASAYAFAFLGQTLNVVQVVGAFLVALAVAIIYMRRQVSESAAILGGAQTPPDFGESAPESDTVR